ncbi:hypothetical protein OUZ56_005681 [Daphnia magna]|uniref:Uncharacterized protein n=1 Tax=Daphnia magna TaxID=35525 RepID=A0ABQ9YTG7_9CRUS|nr:hypothetical protein OUZ56_005681 [Daphnia magna]
MGGGLAQEMKSTKNSRNVETLLREECQRFFHHHLLYSDGFVHLCTHLLRVLPTRILTQQYRPPLPSSLFLTSAAKFKRRNRLSHSALNVSTQQLVVRKLKYFLLPLQTCVSPVSFST